MTLKEFIKSLRVGDAKKFAARLGVSPSYLSQMASGRAAISPTRALMIDPFTRRFYYALDAFTSLSLQSAFFLLSAGINDCQLVTCVWRKI